MRFRTSLANCLRLLIGLIIIVNLVPYQPVWAHNVRAHNVRAQNNVVRAPYRGIWISAEELAALPTSGDAWTELLEAANQNPGLPMLSDQNSHHDIYMLAKALVYARTGEPGYRAEVVAGLQSVMETENGGRTLALGRNLVSYVIAADLVNLPQDPALDGLFRAWLGSVIYETLEGRTLVGTHEERPNNWGTYAGASRTAVALYLGNTTDLKRAADVFHGWLGNRSVYAGFSYGDLDWQCNPSAPTGVNRKGCVINGVDVDGALPEEMRRGGPFQSPPLFTEYAWDALQGAIVQATLLDRAGYPAFEWQDRALLRAYDYLYRIGWAAERSDVWQVWLLNHAYGTNYSTGPSSCGPGFGRNMSWTNWTHLYPAQRSAQAAEEVLQASAAGPHRLFLPVLIKVNPPPKGC